jgi:hypothetical protein
MTLRSALYRSRTLLTIVFLPVFVHLLEYWAVFAAPEGRVADGYLTRATTPRTLKIVTIAIDDDDYREFFDGSSPLDAAALMRLVAAMQGAEPLVIGVDILTESAAYTEALTVGGAGPEPAWTQVDESRVPVVWAAGIEGAAEVKSVNFIEWMWGKHDEVYLNAGPVRGRAANTIPEDGINWGVPVFPSEYDRAVRRLSRHWKSLRSGTAHETFAGEIAHIYSGGRSDMYGDDVFMTWGAIDTATDSHRVRDMFECPARRRGTTGFICEEWTRKPDAGKLEGAIVLLGGTFGASRDFFPTPLGERTPGLVINAHAVRAEILGPPIGELPRLVTWLIDVCVGVLIVLIFKVRPHSKDVVWRVVATAVLGVAAAVVSYSVLFVHCHVLWLSWIAMLLTGLMLHILVSETPQMKMTH